MRDVLVAQITRGLAPAISIFRVSDLCRDYGFYHILFYSLPLVESQNKAIDAAIQRKSDLLICEDDVLPQNDHFDEIEKNRDSIQYAPARMRNGEMNVFKHNGKLLYTGACFLYVPLKVLKKLSHPVFQAKDVVWKNGIGRVLGDNQAGYGSDAYFWWNVQQNTDPIRELPPMVHLRHELNETQNQMKPNLIREW